MGATFAYLIMTSSYHNTRIQVGVRVQVTGEKFALTRGEFIDIRSQSSFGTLRDLSETLLRHRNKIGIIKNIA